MTMGHSHQKLAWILLLSGFVAAVFLDPWSLSERDPSALLGDELVPSAQTNPRMLARHAQAVVLAMGFFQLAVCRLLQKRSGEDSPKGGGTLLLGTTCYVAGHVGFILQPAAVWCVLGGAALNLTGILRLSSAEIRGTASRERLVCLLVLALGMFMDGLSALFTLHILEPSSLGGLGDVRQRMLRLARVASIALPLIGLLYTDLASRVPKTPWIERGRWGTLIGMAGMPMILILASFLWVDFKYLLALPALSMTLGVLIGLQIAWNSSEGSEWVGWLLLVLSINFGLLIGLYAFDGPLLAPAFVGEYNDFIRRLTRLGHSYAIVLGLMVIVLARWNTSSTTQAMLVSGSFVTILGIVCLGFFGQPVLLLVPGPVIVSLALLTACPWKLLSPDAGSEKPIV